MNGTRIGIGLLVSAALAGAAEAQSLERQWGGMTMEPWVSADPAHPGELVVWTAEEGPRIGRHETHDRSFGSEPIQRKAGVTTGDLTHVFVNPSASWGVVVGSHGQAYWKEHLHRNKGGAWMPFMNPPPVGNARLWESAWRPRGRSREGWIVGENETLLHTPDGGATWARATLPASNLAAGTMRMFSAFGLIDRSAGGTIVAAVGGNDGIYCTVDGKTWRRSQVTMPPGWSSPTTVIWDIDFRPGGLLGFAVGGIGIGNGPGFFLCTLDGGATWNPMSGSTPVATVYGVTALSDGTAIASSYGGGVWRFDGPPAPVWDNVSKAGFGPGLFGTGPLWGAHDDGGRRVFVTGQFGEVRRSDDGGKTWTQVRDGAPLMRLRDVAAGSDQVAYAVGQPFGIMKTADGGRTWKAQRSVGNGPNLGGTLQAVAASGPDTAVTIGPPLRRGTPPQALPFPTVVTTRDGGRTWRPALRGALPPGDLRNDVLTDVTVAPGAYWIVGNAGLVWRSVDDGRTWARCTLLGIPTPRDLVFHAVAALNHRVALAVGKRGPNVAAILTLDGGRTWRDASPRTPIPGVLRGAALHNVTGYAVGLRGLVLKLDRLTARLTRVPQVTTADLESAALASDGTVTRLVIGGEGGTLLVRDERNATPGPFRRIASKTTTRIFGLTLRSPRLGWITGRHSEWGDSTILKLTDR